MTEDLYQKFSAACEAHNDWVRTRSIITGNPTVKQFRGLETAETVERWGCSALVSHPFTVVIHSEGLLLAVLVRTDEAKRVRFKRWFDSDGSQFVRLTAEDANKMLDYGEECCLSNISWEAEIWSAAMLTAWFEDYAKNIKPLKEQLVK